MKSLRSFFSPCSAGIRLRVLVGQQITVVEADRVQMLVDDGRIGIATSFMHRLGCVGVTVDLGQVVASRAANEVSQPFDALDEPLGRLLLDKADAQK